MQPSSSSSVMRWLAMSTLWASASLVVALWPRASAAQTIRVVTENSAWVQQQDGKVGGPATEITEKALQLAGFKDYRINLYPWARSYEIAQTEPNALIYMLARTPERESMFQWVGEYMQIRYSLYRLRTRGDVNGTSLAAARAQVVGVVREDLRHQYLRKQGLTRLVLSGNANENFAQLLHGQVDLIPLSDQGAVNLCKEFKVDCATTLEKQMPLDETTVGLYLAFSKDTAPDVVRRLSTAFEQLRANGTVRKLMESVSSR